MNPMSKTNRAAPKKKAKSGIARLPKKVAGRKITGTVLKIVNGRPTDEKMSAQKAFGDLEQARAQVFYAEKHSSREEKRLVRLAFRAVPGHAIQRKVGQPT